jgi:hypothetical protein
LTVIDYRAFRADAAHALGDVMDGFRPGAAGAELLRVHDAVSLHFHTIAVACLLVDGDSQKLFLNLTRCAENGLRFLKLLRHRALPLPSASKNTPLLCALAAGDLERAASIAALSRDDRDEAAREYEDEFLWARALQLLAAPRPDAASIEPLLARLVELDPAAYGDRAATVRALLAGDAAAFEEAIAGAALVYAQATEERAKSFTTPVTTFAPHRFVWLEGLALLRLGERAGLRVERELRYCPRLARVPMTARYEGDWAIEIGGAA